MTALLLAILNCYGRHLRLLKAITSTAFIGVVCLNKTLEDLFSVKNTVVFVMNTVEWK